MKAAIFAVLFLCIIDFAINHGTGTYAFFRGVSGVGHAVGEWVFYT